MAEADRFLFEALAQSECLPATAQGMDLKDLPSSVFVSIVWRCLTKMQECEAHLAFQIPNDLDAQGGVAARHRVGSQLANILKELGYAGDCGYNHFLYPNEKESRGILSWLVGKLPVAESETKEPIGVHPEEATFNNISAADCLAEQPLAEIVAKWMKRKTLYLVPSRVVPTLRGFEKLPLRTSQVALPWRDDSASTPHVSASLLQSTAPVSSRAVSVLEAMAVAQRLDALNIESFDDADDFPGSPSDFGGQIMNEDTPVVVDSHLTTSLTGDEVGLGDGLNPVVLPPFFVSAAGALKENALAQLEASSNSSGAEITIQSENMTPFKIGKLNEEAEQANLEHIHVRLMETEQRIDQLRDELNHDHEELVAIQSGVKEKKSHGAILKKELTMKQQILDLLPQAEANAAKLEAICVKNELKLEELVKEWETHKRPLEAEEQALMTIKSTRKARCRQFVAEMKTFRAEMKEMAATIQEKMEALRVLDKMYANLPQNINRNSYTNRITDIIKQVHKQKQEIGRILEDIKSIQKQLNFSSEKLKRSEAVADEKLFGEASKQVNSSKDANNPYVECYRKFAQVRELFEELILVVGDVGKKENTARDLENWITQLQGRDSSEQLDRVLADLQSVRQENVTLSDQLRALRGRQ